MEDNKDVFLGGGKPPRSSIKENWNKVDEVCPHCNQVTKRAKGITKQNLKRLVTPKLNMNEFIITFIIILVLILAYSYKTETQVCRNWIEGMNKGSVEDCKAVCNYQCDASRGNIKSNVTNPIQNVTFNFSSLK